jgi:DNA polymerase-4
MNVLVKEELVAKTVGIRLRDENFDTINRSFTFAEHTDVYEMFFDAGEALFEENYHEEPLRLVGVFMNAVMQKKDLKIDYNLFTYQSFTKREEQMYQSIEKKKTS